LDNYQGKCSNIHGHTWTVEVVVAGDKLDRCGMLLDFKILKEKLLSVIGDLDHGYLNEIEPFSGGAEAYNPTAENIARYIYTRIAADLEGAVEGLKVRRVRVWESPEASACYYN
jgi:6-pyruvoyltetrahydropterin/6-carboxytetrahydropterin synthase